MGETRGRRREESGGGELGDAGGRGALPREARGHCRPSFAPSSGPAGVVHAVDDVSALGEALCAVVHVCPGEGRP